MGGYGSGSGRHRYGTKATTNGSLPLDVRRIYRDGFLRPGVSFQWTWYAGSSEIAAIAGRLSEDRVALIWCEGGERVRQTVPLDWTPCHFGGRRPWWVCPKCGRRAAVLYAAGKLFTCRKCGGLAYPSQRQGEKQRLLARVDAIRRRLGADNASGLFPRFFALKPKGMHESTYLRLWREYERLEERYLAAQEAEAEMMCRHIEQIRKRS